MIYDKEQECVCEHSRMAHTALGCGWCGCEAFRSE